MMFGLRGYCQLSTYDDVVIGIDEKIVPDLYEEVKKKIIFTPLRIIDVGVDGDGFLCLPPDGNCIISVNSKKSVWHYFLCSEFNGVLIPPIPPECEGNIFSSMVEFNKRITIPDKHYDKFVRAAVITNSLLNDKFDDSFLFTKK